MMIEKELAILQKINKVEVPDTLYATIEQRLRSEPKKSVANKWSYIAVAALAAMITIDSLVIIAQKRTLRQAEIEALDSEDINQLYK